ncbi:carbohydrate ABC transporter permease [Ruania halotolerans]|uniref:carbohydrate ABC transporter permease n=1 Tax=Ruania halotolerans TaxID=2897773 RepID=UPI001E481972|nr:sugar ABC transporter permease [Ruania halotolerans]UFU06855.1 sugar ABC transporter permease [Ruania halotolerans]
MAVMADTDERQVVPHRRSRWSRTDTLRGWAFLAPALALVVFFFIVPVGLVVYMSATDWTLFGGFTAMNFPQNFVDIASDPMFAKSLEFTLKYTVLTTVILMPLAFFLALLVQEARQWNKFLRTAILLPSALGIASSSLLFYALYSPQVGPLNPILDSLGLMDAQQTILGTADGALWATVVLVVWRFTGYFMLLTLIGVQAIPGDIYEAANLDGAGRLRKLRSITLPMLKPTIAMTMILSVTGSLLAFDQFFILTKGGPNNETLTTVLLIYKYAFETKKDLGMAAALSVVVLLALVIINVLQLRALGVGRSEEK